MNRYWKRKRKAAHFILGHLVKSTFIQLADINAGVRRPLYSKTYTSQSIEDLQTQSNGKFDLDIMRDAADLLSRNDHIEYSSKNTKNENQSLIRATKEGEFAFQEEFYLMQIRDDTFKRSINTSNLITPILTLLVAALALIRTCAGCDKQTVEVVHTDKPRATKQTTTRSPTLLSADSLTKGRDTARKNLVVPIAKQPAL